MPRGVYDRSALKAKRAATKATKAATKATVAAEMAITKSKQVAKEEAVGGSLGETYGFTDVHALRSHLGHLVGAWEKIAGNTQGQHNPALLASLDSEIIATVSSLKTWREAAFPAQEKKAPTAPAAAPATSTMKPVAAPLTPPAPAPMPAPAPGAAPAPLPFTPAAVQEVMKQAGQA